MGRWLFLIVIGCVLGAVAPRTHAQVREDLRDVHELAAYATVRISTGTHSGSGWLLEQADARALVITNRHVSETARGPIDVAFYQGSSAAAAMGTAHLFYQSDTIDLAIFQLDADPPANARALSIERGDVARGERIVLAGNPGELWFQTTEGVVTGALPATTFTSNWVGTPGPSLRSAAKRRCTSGRPRRALRRAIAARVAIVSWSTRRRSQAPRAAPRSTRAVTSWGCSGEGPSRS